MKLTAHNLKPEVRRKFLRDNVARLYKLESQGSL